ncbi:MAG: TrmO family methyltransferase domain-containing protein [Planctomycetota bacterium]
MTRTLPTRGDIWHGRSNHDASHWGHSVVVSRGQRDAHSRCLYFSEVDILDGTPLLDIKPYLRQFDSREDAVSGWLERHFRGGQSPQGVVVG